MKNPKLLLILFLIAGAVLTSCKKDGDDDDDNNNDIPDTIFEIEVSGAETFDFDITIPSGAAQTDFAIAGSYSGAANLLSLNFSEIPSGWSLIMTVKASSLTEGTYHSDPDQGAISGYNNTGANPFSYLSTSFSVTLTKVKHFASSSGVSVHYIDGTYSGVLADPNDATKVVNVSGFFSGVATGSQ